MNSRLVALHAFRQCSIETQGFIAYAIGQTTARTALIVACVIIDRMRACVPTTSSILDTWACSIFCVIEMQSAASYTLRVAQFKPQCLAIYSNSKFHCTAFQLCMLRNFAVDCSAWIINIHISWARTAISVFWKPHGVYCGFDCGWDSVHYWDIVSFLFGEFHLKTAIVRVRACVRVNLSQWRLREIDICWKIIRLLCLHVNRNANICTLQYDRHSDVIIITERRRVAVVLRCESKDVLLIHTNTKLSFVYKYISQIKHRNIKHEHTAQHACILMHS